LEKPVLLGEISGAFGIQGWVKIHSYTDPVSNILKYSPWFLEKDGHFTPMGLLSGKQHGASVLALLEGISDRDAAALMRGTQIWVDRKVLPAPAAGEYYWFDLIGLKVKTVEQVDLGIIVQMMATGANDVMVIRGEREHLVPFVKERFVVEVNQNAGEIIVDWDPDF
jgi:16S rRNA processing protein RimM